mmetsp:Transcript_43324/g.63582  ORF Transcript_43324/g.63582 Transcript_43324/m.63582 type:complete len:389 (+) Transcript_43324:56-1222(+)
MTNLSQSRLVQEDNRRNSNNNNPPLEDKIKPITGKTKTVTTKKENTPNTDTSNHNNNDDNETHNDTNNDRTAIICLSSGLSRKANPLYLSSWVKLALTLDGRDKLTKTVQYLSRFVAWYYESLMLSKQKAKPYRELQAALTTSRKAFRLGRFLIEFHKLRIAFPSLLEALQIQKSDSDNKSTTTATTTNITPVWKSAGICCKLIGLAGFWFGDNLVYLQHSGFLPNINKTKAKTFATRSYFFSAFVGLFVSYKELCAHRSNLIKANKRVKMLCHEIEEKKKKKKQIDINHKTESEEEEEEYGRLEYEKAVTILEEARSRQFVLFLALLKSCCDTTVFSNMPGVDLHTKLRNKKMNEGFQCICALTSASTVLYNNFPNKQQSPKKKKVI